MMPVAARRLGSPLAIVFSLLVTPGAGVHAAPLAPAASPGEVPPVSTATPAPGEMARLKYRQGAAAFKATHFREAIDLFLEADRLAPSAALSFNIARAYEQIDDAAAALRWYRDYLRRAPGAADGPQVSGLVQALEARLESKGVQQITVRSEPARATVTLDGQPVGVTPWTGELPPGAHRVELHMQGYASVERAVDLPKSHAMDLEIGLPREASEPATAPALVPPPASAPSALPPPPPQDKRPHSGSNLTTFGWIGVAAGGAALGGALVFEILRRGAESDAKHEPTQIGYAAEADTMESRQTAARVLAGTGAALALAGGALLWFGREPRASGEAGGTGGTALRFACSPTGCGSTVRGRF